MTPRRSRAAKGSSRAPGASDGGEEPRRLPRRRRRRRRRAPAAAAALAATSALAVAVVVALSASAPSLLPLAGVLASDAPPPPVDAIVDVDPNDGPSNLREGLRLFELERYDEASSHLWRAVVLQPSLKTSRNDDGNDDDGNSYDVDEAFVPFLKCYLHRDRIADGLLFVSAEGYLRGQDAMGEMYLEQALERDPNHAGALELKRLTASAGGGADGGAEGGGGGGSAEVMPEGVVNLMARSLPRKFRRIQELRDAVDLSDPRNRLSGWEGRSVEAFDTESSRNPLAPATKDPNDLDVRTPEELYHLATLHFNSKDLPRAGELFELSCERSGRKLHPACVNAVYVRTNLCDWGRGGEQFEKDMEAIRSVTEAEAKRFRAAEKNLGEEARRLAGLGLKVEPKGGDDEGAEDEAKEEEVPRWRRSTSVNPHMMLGYPFKDDDVVLKRYAAESQADMDDLRSRLEDDGSIRALPPDLPYGVKEMRDYYLEKRRERSEFGREDPIKVGFVGCGFNAKAVLYLSHDLFRFFDPDVVEVHVFSTGEPDHPRFVEEILRGVDWRRRVIDAADYFHDVRDYGKDHVGLARFVRSKDVQILVEWDGYARQGERAQGLMALRPAPIQVLHQEFLMTSGARYVDYIVTDEVVSPREREGLYAEKFLYLPNHFFSKGHRVQEEVAPPTLDLPPRDEGEPVRIGIGTPQENACRSPNPLGDDGRDREVSFVYCNFNKFLKHNPETTRSWLRILDRAPDSVLCLLENPPEGVDNFRTFVREVAAESDADEGSDDVASDLNDRIHFIRWEQNPFDHQRRYRSLCNAMLDSHPYNGHTTAQDALYAGVPVITRSDGIEMSSRVSTSANVVLGLEELNAPGGVEEYVEVAVRSGTDREWFEDKRTRLIETCLRRDPMHPYWDVPRYVKNFETGLKAIWERFLDGAGADHVVVEEDEATREGTSDAEMAAREAKRRERKRRREEEGS